MGYTIFRHTHLVGAILIQYIWVNLITTEPCSPSPGIMVNKGNHPLLWPQDSGVWIIIICPEYMGLLQQESTRDDLKNARCQEEAPILIPSYIQLFFEFACWDWVRFFSCPNSWMDCAINILDFRWWFPIFQRLITESWNMLKPLKPPAMIDGPMPTAGI